MRLHYAETINGRKACAVARHLDSPVAFVRVDLARGGHGTPAFRTLNPNAKVPVLETDTGAIWESNAIMCYLARKAGSDLCPTDDRLVDVIRWLSWSSEHFSRYAGRLYFEHLIKPMFNLGAPDASGVAEAIGYIRKYGAILNDHLRGRRYLVGDALTIADFSVGISLPYAEAARIPVQDFPEIMRWHARLNELPAWRAPFPQDQVAA